MEFPESLHPQDFVNRIKLFWNDFLLDIDLRYPEVRRRWAFELESQIPDESKVAFEGLVKRFHLAKRVISILDWPLLLEWGERRNQGIQLAVIDHYLQQHKESRNDPTEFRVRKTLERIQEKILEEPIPEKVSFIFLIGYRWRWTAERALVQYLVERKLV